MSKILNLIPIPLAGGAFIGIVLIITIVLFAISRICDWLDSMFKKPDTMSEKFPARARA